MSGRRASVDGKGDPLTLAAPRDAQLAVDTTSVGARRQVVLVGSSDRTSFLANFIGAVLVAALTVTAFATRSVSVAMALGMWGAFGVVAAIVDLRTARLPDRIVLPGFAFSLLAAAFAGYLGTAVVGGVLFGLPLLAAHLMRPDGMGFGDVKYAAMLGAGIGTIAVPLILPAYLLASALQASACIAVRARSRPVPFGPALFIGSITTVIVALVRT